MELRLRFDGSDPRPAAALWLPRGASAAAVVASLRSLGLPPAAFAKTRCHAVAVAGERACLAVWPAGATPAAGARARLPVGAVALARLAPSLYAPTTAATWPATVEGELAAAFPEDAAPTLWLPRGRPMRLGASAPLGALVDLGAWRRGVAEPAREPLRVADGLPPLSFDVGGDELERLIEPPIGDAAVSDRLTPLSVAERATLEALRRLVARGDRFSERLAERLAGEGETPRETLERLEARAGDEFDRLERMFADDPLEALRHSPSLDDTGRGIDLGEMPFRLRRLWGSLRLDAGTRGEGHFAGGSLGASRFSRLRELYQKTLADLAAEGRHREAGFVYLKLLRDPRRAADYLRTNGLYLDAAEVYLRHLREEFAAAECYQEARRYRRAAELFAGVHAYERAGDALSLGGERDDARAHYRRAAARHREAGQPVEEARLEREKLAEPEVAQAILDAGFRADLQAKRCLRAYLAHLPDDAARLDYLAARGADTPDPARARLLLAALARAGDSADAEARARREDIAYDIAARHPDRLGVLDGLPSVVADDELGRDVRGFAAQTQRRRGVPDF